MNLNQSAHGDREFAYIAARLRHPHKTVAGHWQDPAVQRRIGAWARAAAGVHEGRHLKVCRFGDNMRHVADTDGDKTEVQARLGVSVNTWAVNDLVAVIGGISDAEAERLCAEYDEAYEVVPELRPGGERRRLPARGGPHRAGPARLPLRRRLRRLHGHLRGPRRPAPAAGHRGAAAHGRRLRLRGRGRLEVLAPSCASSRSWPTGLPGGTSFMEDYTYDFGSPGQTLGAHMLEICPTIAADRPRAEIHPLFVGGREDPVRLVFTGAPGPAVIVGLVDMGNRLRLLANEVDAVEPPEDLPKLPVARALWEPRPDLATAAETWLSAGGPHHTCYSLAVDLEVIRDFATMVGVELLSIGAGTDAWQFQKELQWGQVYWHLAGAV